MTQISTHSSFIMENVESLDDSPLLPMGLLSKTASLLARVKHDTTQKADNSEVHRQYSAQLLLLSPNYAQHQ